MEKFLTLITNLTKILVTDTLEPKVKNLIHRNIN
ncbi:hypothetical protein SAMN06297164_2236 [Nitrosomonas ureae]|uniref:Uncharacterized protein n=1 Tax=Nitrosomonas ureae TaxID=44577 RepID=A0A286ABI6_9PROT|nr:hypothetical protein SAMN06297164_2236 [Nitrosomonas ureae]